nr:prenyltransferase/squalene oxidase repeat-containing protein [Streptomyces chartreusis]
MDIELLWHLRIDQNAKQEALDWLAAEQQQDGCWRDWHGVESSPEATAYAAYILKRGHAVHLANIDKALEALITLQRVDGLWSMSPDEVIPSNWVTFTALLALREFAPTRLRGSVTQPATKAIDIHSTLPQRLYDVAIRTPLDAIPHTRPIDHTMYRALDSYVSRKIPVRLVEEALANDMRVEVHGIYPPHFRTLARQWGYTDFKRIRFRRVRSGKHFNSIRPWFFRATRPDGEPIIAASVVPGADYVLQYASMVRHVALMATTQGERLLDNFRYPYAESQIADWTALDDKLVEPGNRVLLGHVDEVRDCLVESSATLTDWQETDYYGASKCRLPDGSYLTLLGVKFSYWGSISHNLCHRLCNLGAREILYIAKLGALTSPDDIYARIFCPSRFWILQHDRLIYEVPQVCNHFLSKFPDYDTGGNISVPTVLEEDYHQRKIATDLQASSIDNEISQMAWAVALANASNGTDVSFSSLHFATDYVRQPGEKILSTSFDLARNRQKGAVSAKSKMINEITYQALMPYFGF